MFGDYLLKNLDSLKNADPNAKKGENAFWYILQKCAIQDIIAIYPNSVRSDEAIETYYTILKTHEEYIPHEVLYPLNSNSQESYRVKIRNLFTSNSNHKEGLKNRKEIIWNEVTKKNHTKRVTKTTIYTANPFYLVRELLKDEDIDLSGTNLKDELGSDEDNILTTKEVVSIVRNQLKRDNGIRDEALERAHHTCEYCGAKQTFSTNAGNQFFEGHHLIMLNQTVQSRYTVSLDNVNNIFCLCPMCHRKIHFADDATREEMVRTLLNKHRRLKTIYSINNEDDIQAIINDYNH